MEHTQKETKYDLSIIIVNHNSDEFLTRCIENIVQNIQNQTFEIIVVDNGQQTFSFPDINTPHKYLPAKINKGFGHANNLGALHASGKFYFLLNPDTLIPSSGIDQLISEIKQDARTGIVGPRLLTQNNKTQPWCTGCPVSPVDTILNNVGLIQSKRLWERNFSTSVAWVSGAALLIKADLFRKLAGFDENFFLYFEDVDLCKRAKDLGYTIKYIPSISITHLGGSSMDSIHSQKDFFYQSQDYYFKKHFGKTISVIMKMIRNFCLRLTKH